MKIYNVGIIGTGQIAGSIDDDRKRKSVWSHAGAYKLCTRTKIVAACDIDHERLESFGKSWKVGRLYRDYRDMLKSEEIDIVSICAPTKTHYEILKNVAGCGIKAIFCEKPLAFSYKQCSQAVDICRKNNVLLAVNYFRRWDNLYLKIKEIIDSKQFGTIKTMVSYSNTALYMNASHMIDLMLMLGGRISKVYGKMDSSFVRKVHGLEDPGGIFHFTTESGMEELLYAAGDSQLKHQFEIDLQFTNGRIRSSCYGSKNECFVYKSSKQLGGLLELVPVKFPEYHKNERMVTAVENIVSVLAGTAAALNCSGEDAAESVKVIEACYRSSEKTAVVRL